MKQLNLLKLKQYQQLFQKKQKKMAERLATQRPASRDGNLWVVVIVKSCVNKQAGS